MFSDTLRLSFSKASWARPVEGGQLVREVNVRGCGFTCGEFEQPSCSHELGESPLNVVSAAMPWHSCL